ncbi:MAG: hypothetical protein WBD36_17350, partial [Bacteroidota bacterium]
MRDFIFVGSNIFVGVEHFGVFLSSNEGSSWTQVSSGLPGDTIAANGRPYWGVTALAASGSALFAGTYYGGIYLSTNNGTSWTAANNGLRGHYHFPYGAINSLEVAGSSIFAGTDGGVFCSTDNGASWAETNTGIEEFARVRGLVCAGTDLFAGAEYGGVFRSTNGGASWSQTGLDSIPVFTLYNSGTTMLAETEYPEHVYRSTNNGIAWSRTSLDSNSIHSFASSGSCLFAAVGPGYFGRPLWSSTDDGATWAKNNSIAKEGGVESVFASGTNVFAVTDSVFPCGILCYTNSVSHSTDDGKTWAKILDGKITSLVSFDSIIVASWEVGGGSSGGAGRFPQSNGLTKMAGPSSHAIIRSTDNGATWQHMLDIGGAGAMIRVGNNIIAAGEFPNIVPFFSSD